jgi:hypothetical protein
MDKEKNSNVTKGCDNQNSNESNLKNKLLQDPLHKIKNYCN